MGALIDHLPQETQNTIRDLISKRGNELLTRMRTACSTGDWEQTTAVLLLLQAHSPELAKVGAQYLREFEEARFPERFRIGVAKSIGSTPQMLFYYRDPDFYRWLRSKGWVIAARYVKHRRRAISRRGPHLALYVAQPDQRLLYRTPWGKPLETPRGHELEEAQRMASACGITLCQHVKDGTTRKWWSKHSCNLRAQI